MEASGGAKKECREEMPLAQVSSALLKILFAQLPVDCVVCKCDCVVVVSRKGGRGEESRVMDGWIDLALGLSSPVRPFDFPLQRFSANSVGKQSLQCWRED